jgi:hypothetical protein
VTLRVGSLVRVRFTLALNGSAAKRDGRIVGRVLEEEVCLYMGTLGHSHRLLWGFRDVLVDADGIALQAIA